MRNKLREMVEMLDQSDARIMAEYGLASLAVGIMGVSMYAPEDEQESARQLLNDMLPLVCAGLCGQKSVERVGAFMNALTDELLNTGAENDG